MTRELRLTIGICVTVMVAFFAIILVDRIADSSAAPNKVVVELLTPTPTPVEEPVGHVEAYEESHPLLRQLDGVLKNYLKHNEAGTVDSEMTGELLRSGSELAMAFSKDRSAKIRYIDPTEAKRLLNLVTLAVGCRVLEPDNNDRLLRINIVLDYDHRPMCEHRDVRLSD